MWCENFTLPILLYEILRVKNAFANILYEIVTMTNTSANMIT